MDILYTTRKENKITGWNSGKSVYNREFETIKDAKIIAEWVKQYLANYGIITVEKMDFNTDYLLKHMNPHRI